MTAPRLRHAQRGKELAFGGVASTRGATLNRSSAGERLTWGPLPINEPSGRVLLMRRPASRCGLDLGALSSLNIEVAEVATIGQASELLARQSHCVVIVVVSTTAMELPASGLADLRTANPDAVFIVVLTEDCAALPPARLVHDSVVGVLRCPCELDALARLVDEAMLLHRKRDLAAGLRAENWGDGLLLVEDCLADAYLCRELLQEVLGSVNVYEAATLAHGIELARRQDISLALVDLGLPDAHGLDVVRQIRAAVPALPLVVLSGMAEDLSEQALALGAQQVLSKNEMTPQALARCLRRARLVAGATMEVHYLATHDPLTGLLNSQQFREQLATTLSRLKRQASECALIYLDLDGFKPVNDTYGHAMGDQVLELCAERLRGELRDFDMAGRMGGDEFAVLVEGTGDTAALSHIAERILQRLSEPMALEQGITVEVSASLGIATFPNDAMSVADLIAAADLAMYRAKRGGSGRYVFHCSRPSRMPPSPSLPPADLAIRDAVQQRRFGLAFQPLVDLESREPVCFEALLRLQHDGVELEPARLVGLLEQMELMNEVGRWVLSEACRAAAARRQRGCPARVAVNLSAQQLSSGDLFQTVAQVLDEYQVPPDCLELEVTERVLDATPMAHWEPLAALREHGVRIVLDDFGLGTSSLHSLRELPMDGLKVDGVLVDEAASDPLARRLLSGLIELAHGMGYVVTAERIEHDHQAQLLRRMGCDYGQGYLYGIPTLMPRAA